MMCTYELRYLNSLKNCDVKNRLLQICSTPHENRQIENILTYLLTIKEQLVDN